MNKWVKKSLGEVIIKVADRDHFTPIYVESGVAMISPKDISLYEKIDFSDCKYITREAHELNRKKTDLKTGDLVFTRIGALLGKVCIVESWMPEFSILHSAAMIRADNSIIDSQYLMYFIKSIQFQSQIKNQIQSIGVPDLGLEKIKRFEIAYPSNKNGQRQIAKILSSCDIVIENTQAAIGKYKAIKQGMLQDLFTRGININTGKLRPKYKNAPELYKESNLGMVPKEWVIERVDKLVKITTGSKDTQNKEEKGEYPFFVRSQTIEKISSYSYDGEAILTSGDGVGVGKIYHYINGKFDFHQRVYMLYEFEKNIVPKYLFYYFSNNFLAEVDKYSAKTTVDSVRREMIAGMLVPQPDILEQKEIAKKLVILENKLNAEEIYLYKLQQIKAGLMGDLLNGKKEVCVKDKEGVING
jgi:type I restriction enzyme S subunit